jgi:hypothetical protein
MPMNQDIPLFAAADPPRASYQALAERLAVPAPGVSISDESIAFADAGAKMAWRKAQPGNQIRMDEELSRGRSA